MSKENKDLSDEILVGRIKKGDRDALEEIVKRYSQKIYNLALHVTRDAAAAEEIMQEVFLTILSKIHALTHDAYFSTWLYRVAMNAAYGYLRKERKYTEQTVSEDLENETAAEYDWSSLSDDILVSEESKDILRTSIDSLPDTMRMVVILKDVEGFKNEEISQALDLSVPAVKSRLHRGRLILRRALGDYFRRYSYSGAEE
ncbi:MAG TPA: sigma-70 family RNA polymerase sigma factor [Deltaproteobacteria bacterium]|nr:sigma-70 family RNA polymerase sigma factor [Deltaproteobacteria bacterium]